MLEPLVRRDHARVERNREHRRGIGSRPSCHHHRHFIRHAFLRWHYPGQVLRVDGAVAALSARLPRAPRYAQSIVAPEAYVDELAATQIGRTFNQYAEGSRAPLLRERLAAYLESRAHATILLVGEAPGYRGARVSGIPFTSERQLTGSGPAEATSTIVHRVLGELGIDDHVLLWNVVPMHPGTATSNRRPTTAETVAGLEFVAPLAEGRSIVAVGRVAERALGAPAVRHPSHGGAQAFRAELVSALPHEAAASMPR